MQALVQGLKAVPEQLRALMEEHDRRSEELAHRFESTQVMIFLRRGIKPDCPRRRPEAHRDLLFAEVYPAGEMKHGPIALLDSRVPVVSIAVLGTVFDKVFNNAQGAKARDTQLIGVATECPEAELFDTLLLLLPLPLPVVDELLWDHIATHRGLDVEHPRSLVESVTLD